MLVACAGPQAPDVADGAPPKSIRPSQVADAVPRADPILSAGNYSPYTVRGVEYRVMKSAHNYREEGIASWYGTKFHGRQTSNGEVFDLYAATAAHKTLPIPSYARVTNLDNGRSVTVRVNDRGPFHADRLIDLSYGAAVKLGYMERGTAPVRVEVLNIAGVEDRRGMPQGQYRFLQLGAFGSRDAAVELQQRVAGVTAQPVFLSPVESGGAVLHRVRVGPVDDPAQLEATRDLLQRRGFGSPQRLP
jgi:rare lipoprotein A